MTGKKSPSEERRKALKATEANKILKISNLTPIERYYDVADKLKQRFESSFKEHNLDNAYVYGIRFAKFSTDALPHHDYYKVSRTNLKTLRQKNRKELVEVLNALEEVVQLMDLEELEQAEIRRREEAALAKIREREELMKKEEEDRRAQKELLDRLNALDTMFPKPPTGVGESQTNGELPSYDQAQKMRDQLFSSISLDADLPPPIPFSTHNINNNNVPSAPSAPPPSYDDIIQQNIVSESSSSRDFMNDSLQQTMDFTNSQEPATLANPLGPLLPASLNIHGKLKKSTFKVDIPVATLKYTSRSEYQTLCRLQKIQVFQLKTYQGKYSQPDKDSTNGCTVISPLIAINHLSNENGGISDMMIENVIDNVAPSILIRVRRKLGLAAHALIIPSDVHDFLVDEKILKQEMFVGVCGGNLLDGDHVNDFLHLLENGEDSNNGSDGIRSKEEKKDFSKKVAAALFFHEHVVSILKVVLPDGTSWYDLVDSLPRRVNDTLGATRTRCKDLQSLQTVLQWYACSKFSSADEKYIDTNIWEDMMCNFDPRVFQAFVWKE